MTRSDEHRIGDILNAAIELAEITGRSREAFDADPILRRAAERLLEIIGEATNLLSDATTSRHPQVPWRDIACLIWHNAYFRSKHGENVAALEGEIRRAMNKIVKKGERDG